MRVQIIWIDVSELLKLSWKCRWPLQVLEIPRFQFHVDHDYIGGWLDVSFETFSSNLFECRFNFRRPPPPFRRQKCCKFSWDAGPLQDLLRFACACEALGAWAESESRQIRGNRGIAVRELIRSNSNRLLVKLDVSTNLLSWRIKLLCEFIQCMLDSAMCNIV